MKFRTIFIFFNIVLVFSLLIVAFLPLFLIGWELTHKIWLEYWFLFLIFFIGLGLINFFFLRNLKLMNLIEEENWPAVLEYAEEKMALKALGEKEARVYIHTSIFLGQIKKLHSLRDYLHLNSPALKEKLGLYLGLPYFVEGDLEESVLYYKDVSQNKRSEYQQWARWLFCFSRLGLDPKESPLDFLALAQGTQDPLIRLLSLYLLETRVSRLTPDAQQVFHQLKDPLSQFSHAKWLELIKKEQSKNILLLLMQKILQDALDWLKK